VSPPGVQPHDSAAPAAGADAPVPASPGAPGTGAEWVPPPVDEGGEPRGGVVTGLLRFFVVPLVLVGASLAVFAGLGAVVGQGAPTKEKLLERVADGGKNERWQAAMELANRVAAGEVDLANDEALGAKAVEAFRRARDGGDDPRVLRYLSRFLAASPLPAAGEALADAAADAEPDVRLFAVEALARRGGAAGLEAVLPRLADADPGVRALAAYATGAIAEGEGVPEEAKQRAGASLRALLDEDLPDPRWNAALALARLGIPGGEDEIWRMLHRDYLRPLVAPAPSGAEALLSAEGADPSTPDAREDRVLCNALAAVWRRRDLSMIEAVRALADEDRSPTVKHQALRVREALDAEAKSKGAVPAPRAWPPAR
jgi:hypothetical protein